METHPIQYCKRILIEASRPGGEPTVLLGQILSDDPLFLTFKTGSGREYLVAKKHVLRVEDTLIPFKHKEVRRE